MALDTIKLRSPSLPEDVASWVEGRLVLRQAIDNPTGELLYSLTTGSLEGSYDHRVSVAVKREEWVSIPRKADPRRRDVILRPCAPYLETEASVHKAMLGHNVYGGPCDVLPSCEWFISHLAKQLGCELPGASEWLVRKIDKAEIYRLREDALSYEATEKYVQGLNSAAFPRRQVGRWGDQSLSCPGDTTTIKVYHKGPEFSKHDRQRLRKLLSPGELANLQHRANELLRTEVSIKAPKLDGDFGHAPTVGEMTEAYLDQVYDREMARLLREGGAAMKTVRKHNEVRDRLYEVYDVRLARALFGTWLQLAALGEKVTREKLPRRTFYRHRRQLQEAGIAWLGADVRIVETASIVPADFSPVRSDPRRVVGEHPKITELLAPFREREHVA